LVKYFDVNNYKMNMIFTDNKISDVIKLNIIKNALDNGWMVEVYDNRTVVLKKKKIDLSFDENSGDELIDKLLNIRTFKNFDKNIGKK